MISASSHKGYDLPGSAATGLLCHFVPARQRQPLLSRQPAWHVHHGQIPDQPTLALTLGVRYDWDGGLTEKYGRIFNFDAGTSHCRLIERSSYSYCVGSDTILNPGLIIAGNNANGSKGMSDTTLTGRQWGVAPRFGAAWQPGIFHSKLVVRTGAGFYYDRGELFTYFSPGYAIGTVTGGPFGVNQQLPFVNESTCPSASVTLYEFYLPTCGGGRSGRRSVRRPIRGNMENPYGTTLEYAAPTSPKASDLSNLPSQCLQHCEHGIFRHPGPLRNRRMAAKIINNGQPISLGVYDRANKLPYTMNYTLDLQWQPRNDMAVEVGYVGNMGRHQVIPVPFNQPAINSKSTRRWPADLPAGLQLWLQRRLQ